MTDDATQVLRGALALERAAFDDFLILEMAWRLGVEVEREVDGRWIAEVADIPGALAYGNTRNEAIEGVLPFIRARNAELRAKREIQEHNERVFLWTVGGFMACVLLAVAAVLWR